MNCDSLLFKRQLLANLHYIQESIASIVRVSFFTRSQVERLQFLLQRLLQATTMSSNSSPIELGHFITAIKDISQENIESVKSQLRNSITKLVETNQELQVEIEGSKKKLQQLKPEESHDDLRDDILLFQESIDENEKVITDQQLRVAALLEELVARNLITEEAKRSELQEIMKISQQGEGKEEEKEGVYL